jgi:hypothetical protein
VILGYPEMAAPTGFFEPTIRVGPDRWMERIYLHIDTTGTVVDSSRPVVEIHRTFDTLLPFGLGPFIPRILSAVEPGGDIWIASTDRYTIYRRNPVGDTVMEIRLATGERTLSAEQEDTITAVIDRFHPSPLRWIDGKRVLGGSRSAL